MKNWRQRLHSGSFICTLWVALCFFVTSAVYLSWVNRLVFLTGNTATDWLSLVVGYLFQAAGAGIAILLLCRNPYTDFRRFYTPAVLLLAAVSVPSLLGVTPTGVFFFGFMMNLLCGNIAGFYLYAIVRIANASHLSLVFGGGYAISTTAVGLLALIGKGNLLHSGYALLIYISLSVMIVLITSRLNLFHIEAEEMTVSSQKPAVVMPGKDLVQVCIVVILLSTVKNLGFGFPSADIEAGLIPELSRIPYAIGLTVAGLINDKKRKNGMFCTIAALIIPFIMLDLTSESLPSTICWCLDYLFFGFFSVFRTVLFLDIARQTRHWEWAPLGLLMGRLGDMAGTGINLLLANHRLVLISVTALLFFPTVFLFLRLYLKFYEPEVVTQRSEQEVFETFCLHNDLSSREREVFRMVISDCSNREIAEALFVTESTVKYHVRNVLQKTGCKNRSELKKKYTVALYPQIRQQEKNSLRI